MSEIKYAPPTKYTIAPKGTVTSNPNDSEQLEYWIQVSADSQHPEWLRLGTFLERIFIEQIDDQFLVDNLLHFYEKPAALNLETKGIRVIAVDKSVLSKVERINPDCDKSIQCNCIICETSN